MHDPWIEQAHLAYSSLRRSHAQGTPITVITIGPRQTHLVCGRSITVEATISLDVGSQKTSADHFKHCPPTQGEIEHAILSVEDEIAHTPAALLAGSNLFTTDTAIHEVALAVGLAHQPAMLLSIAEVEGIFDRLTYVVEGRPASSEGLPESSAFSTTLLILREFMHHQGFSSIIVVS